MVDQPSTHAIGSTAVCCGIASRAARSSVTGRLPPFRVSRQPSSVSPAEMPAAAAVRLTSNPLGPSPGRRPRGSSTAQIMKNNFVMELPSLPGVPAHAALTSAARLNFRKDCENASRLRASADADSRCGEQLAGGSPL